MTLLNNAMTILARAQTLAAFAQKYAQYAPQAVCVHCIYPHDDEPLPLVTFYREDLYQLGLVFGTAGWEREVEHGSDYVNFFKQTDGVEVKIWRCALCDMRFEGRQSVTPEEFTRMARDSAPLATAELSHAA
jgi:hypothetical protein